MNASIHLLRSIVEELEGNLSKYLKSIGDNPSDKQKASVYAQEKLINRLRDIADTFDTFIYYDALLEVNNQMVMLTDKDKELTGVVISLPLKLNADRSKYGYISLEQEEEARDTP